MPAPLMPGNDISSLQNPKSRFGYAQELWQKTTNLASYCSEQLDYYSEKLDNYSEKFGGRYTILREVSLIGASALCAYIAAQIFAEPGINAVSKALNICGLSERDGWISLNAPGIALVAAATVPVFQITNKFLPLATNTDGTKKSEHFSKNDARRMAKSGWEAYFSTKVIESLQNIPSYLLNVLHTAHPQTPYLHAGFGIASTLVLQEGMEEYYEEPKTSFDRKWAKLQMMAGGAGLAYTIFGTLYKYSTAAEPICPPSGPCPGKWSWNYWGAPGMASRAAIGMPVQILIQQIFGRILSNKKIPELPRKAIEIGVIALNIITCSALAHYLGLPGARLNDPIETVKSIALIHGLIYGFQRGIPAVLDFIFPDEEGSVPEYVESVSPVDRSILLHPYKFPPHRPAAPAA